MKWNQSFDSSLQEKKECQELSVFKKKAIFFYLECECNDWVHMDVL